MRATHSVLALFTAACALAAAGCSGKPPETAPAATPKPAFASDPSARARLAELKTGMGQLQACSPACLKALEDLHARYSADDEVVEVLRAIYVERRDWDAVIALEEERPEAQRSPEDRARLATFYYQKGRYHDAAELFERLVAERPDDAGLAHQSGITLFHLGDTARAVPRLDKAIAELDGTERAEAATLRALIHFHAGETEQAEKVLRGSLHRTPDYAPTHSALGRVLAARGDTRRAREHLDRAAVLRARIAEQERRALKLSAQSQMVSQAVDERRFDDCERILADMLDEAQGDARLRVTLYRYLAQVRQAAGRPEAAQQALRQADALAAGTPGR